MALVVLIWVTELRDQKEGAMPVILAQQRGLWQHYPYTTIGMVSRGEAKHCFVLPLRGLLSEKMSFVLGATNPLSFDDGQQGLGIVGAERSAWASDE